MAGAVPQALILAGRIVCCALIAFAGAYFILSAWLSRKISSTEAGLLLLGLLILQFLGVSVSLQGGPGILLLIVAVLGVPAGFCLLARRADRRLVNALEGADIAKYRAAMDLDPRNVAAHSLLADTYRRTGRLELAIAEYRAALQIDPSLQTERYWIRRLEERLERQGRKQMSCPRCGVIRPLGAELCPECGRWYSTIETSLHSVRFMRPARKLAWAGAIGAALVALAEAMALAPRAMGWVGMGAVFLAPIALIAISARARRRMG